MTTESETMTRRRFEEPDELRPFEHGHMAVIQCGGSTIGRAVFEPGWRWSTHMKALAGTPSCETAHLGYLIKGRLLVHMDDGTEIEAGPGDLVTVAPGHDAWVVGDEAVEYLELAGAAHYAEPKAPAAPAITLAPELPRDQAPTMDKGPLSSGSEVR